MQIILGLIAMAMAVFFGSAAMAEQPASQTTMTNGLVFLVNNEPDEAIDGLLNWERELAKRDLTAMVMASKPALESNPEVFRRLAEKGHEIIGGYQDVCWDMPFDAQLAAIQAAKTYMENLTGKPMRVFACKYFSYDENTVKAAEALGVPYVLARGAEDIRAMVYRPDEYDVDVLEVSNVEFSEMGRGSLCDISLYWRGATAADFAEVFTQSLTKRPDSMILVSHPHIGGAKASYWTVYEDALRHPSITWRSFEAWLDKVVVVPRPYAEIPENREVQYLEPKPSIPLDQLEDVADTDRKIVLFHNGRGPMCKEAEAFLNELDYPVEEHLVGEKNFGPMFNSYLDRHERSAGVSNTFEYFPVIFVNGRAFSGFDDSVRKAIEAEIAR